MKKFITSNKSDFMKILYFTILLILALGLSEIRSKFLTWEYLIIILGVSLIFLLSIYITGKVIDNSKNLALKNILDLYQSKAEALESDWYYSMQRLKNFEANFKGNEIWVISEYLDYEHSDSAFHEIIKNNLEKKNIIYEYIIPHQKRLNSRKLSILNSFNKKKPKITVINKDKFDYPSDILVFFDNNLKEKINYSVFMELKVDKTLNKRGWARIEEGFGKTIVDNIEYDIEHNSIKSKTA